MARQYTSMMNSMKLATILMWFLISTTLSGQEYWQSTAGPYGGPIDFVIYNSTDEAFAFTHWGGLFYSSNQGDSWIKRGDRAATKAVIDTNDVIITNEPFNTSINRSEDGGMTWTRYANIIPANHVFALAINSANVLFAGTNDKGMFRSWDGGATWDSINTNLTYKQINTISTYGARIYIGTQGGKVFRSNDNGDIWEHPAGSGMADTVITAIQHVSGTTLLAGTARSIFRSADNGDSWTEVQSDLSTVNDFVILSNGTLYAVYQ